MKSFKPSFALGMLAALTVAWTATSPKTVEARPKYKEVFAEKYPALEAQVKKVKCGVCHPPGAEEKKKARNNYGKALGKVLGAKNVANKDTIRKVLTKIEAEPSATEGKTFGDLIQAGQIPGKNE